MVYVTEALVLSGATSLLVERLNMAKISRLLQHMLDSLADILEVKVS